VRTHGDRELAADLVQDTFEAAARAWATLRGQGSGRQRAWLLGTLAHKDISDYRRKEAFRRRKPDIHARYQAAAADTAAQALTAIAAELGVAEGTVHAHLHTARGKLVAGLERYYPFGQDSGKGAPS
jgi:DNA-directed RNA polymerase specialized sigma24 family protein